VEKARLKEESKILSEKRVKRDSKQQQWGKEGLVARGRGRRPPQ